jgi:hypothetical protein
MHCCQHIHGLLWPAAAAAAAACADMFLQAINSLQRSSHGKILAARMSWFINV